MLRVSAKISLHKLFSSKEFFDFSGRSSREHILYSQGNWGARRNKFSDAVDFVGWYHSQTAEKFGVAKNDAFNLYLAYYSGWGGYGRGSWRSNASLQKYARDTEAMAQR